jgi:NADH-quinone oxidoreductase subunit B
MTEPIARDVPLICPGGEGMPRVTTTTVDQFINWFRQGSIWYLLFATACCGIELMQTGGPRTDLDRFGAVFRSSPRQSDLLIVAGTITYKMADRVRLLYAQMAEPKYVLAMGSCANCGGLFQPSYSVVPGVDAIVPVDLYLPGCPPRPEALNEAILRLQDLMRGEHWADRMQGRRRTPEGVVVRGGAPPLGSAGA